ncbi:hypothetical protein BU16DRAFT_620121 [Lophium mytilinum]|uniref:Uncharacterized protein n=1 Tax=Lophium mytilinum TaxID=390894 RepID=A0A6A6QL73_9PEZI|nr:hypothetical protein BU16DRAFT_620121 [Lophium mytilinum]
MENVITSIAALNRKLNRPYDSLGRSVPSIPIPQPHQQKPTTSVTSVLTQARKKVAAASKKLVGDKKGSEWVEKARLSYTEDSGSGNTASRREKRRQSYEWDVDSVDSMDEWAGEGDGVVVIAPTLEEEDGGWEEVPTEVPTHREREKKSRRDGFERESVYGGGETENKSQRDGFESESVYGGSERDELPERLKERSKKSKLDGRPGTATTWRKGLREDMHSGNEGDREHPAGKAKDAAKPATDIVSSRPAMPGAFPEDSSAPARSEVDFKRSRAPGRVWTVTKGVGEMKLEK